MRDIIGSHPLRHWCLRLPFKREFRLVIGGGDIALEWLDWTPRRVRFPHWPAPSLWQRGEVWTLRLTRYAAPSPTGNRVALDGRRWDYRWRMGWHVNPKPAA